MKCAHCDRTLTTPVVCDYCHALNAGATLTDYYTLLGLPRQFDIDDQQLQHVGHPDP